MGVRVWSPRDEAKRIYLPLVCVTVETDDLLTIGHFHVLPLPVLVMVVPVQVEDCLALRVKELEVLEVAVVSEHSDRVYPTSGVDDFLKLLD